MSAQDQAQREKRKQVKREATRALVAAAREGEPMTYNEFTQELKTVSFQPRSPQTNALLSEISRTEDAQGRGMLSVFVVDQKKRRPGDGFFELAEELGRDVSDRDAFFKRELAAVHRYWADQN